MKSHKKILSLNRTIVAMMLFGYCTLMILLVCMDCFLIYGYQESRRLKKEQAVDYYVQKTLDGMDKIRKVLYDVYMNDEDFERLSQNLSEAQKYSHAWELRESLKGNMLVDGGLHGFYIFYGNGTYPLYQINNGQVTPEQGSRLCTALQQLGNRQETVFRNWFCVTMDESVFLVISYKKGAVTVYGIRNIGDAGRVIEADAQRDTQICLVDNGTALLNKDLAEKFDIVSRISAAEGKTDYVSSENHIYGEEIGNTSLWVCAVYKNAFQDYMNIPQIFLLILTACSVVLAFAVYLFLKKNLMMPLEGLRDEMDKIRRDQVKNVPIMDLRFTELREMNETLQEMVTKLEHQRVLTYDAYIEKQKARMQYLQIQMQPHFYLNGLKTLNALVLEKQTGKVQTLLISLSEHLRYLLQVENEMTALRQELDFTENYVNLRNQMTGRTIQFLIEAALGTENCMVPMLTIQTFVENSIKYAKTGSNNIALIIKARVSVLSTEEGDYLDIIVSDNGQGYPQEVLKEINKEPKVGTKCVGIQNLKRRCQILYGAKAEFAFCNKDGAVSECILPGIQEERQDESINCG
ncbi:MAG: histidine kinase [Eubacteriales bacterium]|nr:histidine kinase [Eubacteriales bacterium]